LKDDVKHSPTLDDAKELQLVPSVTTVMQIMATPLLIAWRSKQMMLSSWQVYTKDTDERLETFSKTHTKDGHNESEVEKEIEQTIFLAEVEGLTPDFVEEVSKKLEGESIIWKPKEFFKHLGARYGQQVFKASLLGSKVHNEIENYLIALKNNETYQFPEEMKVIQTILEEWLVTFLLVLLLLLLLFFFFFFFFFFFKKKVKKFKNK